MGAAATLTTAEVAALAGLDERRVRKDVEEHVVEATTPPRFTFPALVYFCTVALLGLQLGVEDRKRLYALVIKALASTRPPTKLEVSPIVEVKLGKVVSDTKDRLDRFTAWKKKLVTDERILGGEPVFPKSRLAVRHVGGMLLRGASIDEVREDYPSLKDEDLEFAKLYAEAYPRLGRPREAREAPSR